MQSIFRRALVALSFGSVISLGACTEVEDVGTVSLDLVGQTPAGTVYRLRDASIRVQGPVSTQLWNTEDDPDRTSLSADVEPGAFAMNLQPGWRLERLVPMAPPVTVEADLLTQNPSMFQVAAGLRTRVPLRFLVDDGIVDLASGYDIEVEIEEAVAPVVTITAGPAVTNDRTPSFAFSVTGNAAVIECRLDGAPFAPCTSPYQASQLSDGLHVFDVRAVDGAGRIGTATRELTIDTVAPTAVFTGGPTTTVYSTTTTFAFTTAGAPVVVECRSFPRGQPGGTFTPCSSPVVWMVQFPVPPETWAVWTFELRATDAAGNAATATYDYATSIVL
jgi:hypothetical protein